MGNSIYLPWATDLTPGETEFDEHEAIDMFKVSLDEAIKMVIDGKITDGKTIAGLLLTKYHI